MRQGEEYARLNIMEKFQGERWTEMEKDVKKISAK